AAPASTGQSQEAVFVRLASDQFAPVRLAALPGLALVGTVPSLCALVELACSDGTSAVRLQALQQMEVLQAEEALHLDRHWWDLLLDRSMDTVPRIRLTLFGLLAARGARAQGSEAKLALVLRQGLEDTVVAVQRECQCMLERLARTSAQSVEMSSLLTFVGHLLSDPLHGELAAERALCCLLSRPDWWKVAEEGIEALLHGQEAISREQALLGRVALALDPEVWSLNKALCGPSLLRKTLQALDLQEE
ncbi:unnamed protein product, partial [Durusdinium trenchii]